MWAAEQREANTLKILLQRKDLDINTIQQTAFSGSYPYAPQTLLDFVVYNCSYNDGEEEWCPILQALLKRGGVTVTTNNIAYAKSRNSRLLRNDRTQKVLQILKEKYQKQESQ